MKGAIQTEGRDGQSAIEQGRGEEWREFVGREALKPLETLHMQRQ